MKIPTLLRPQLAVVYLLILLFVLPVVGQRTRPTTTTTFRKPRLILLIAVDQFRQDYLERFGDLFAKNGIKRLMREGAVWEQAHYDHVPTYTACGHATMMTGAYPAETGIVGNEWIERDTGHVNGKVGKFDVPKDPALFEKYFRRFPVLFKPEDLLR